MGRGGKGKGQPREWAEVTKYDHFERDVKVCTPSSIPSEVEAAIKEAALLGVDFEWKSKCPIAVVSVVTQAEPPSVLLVRVHTAEDEPRKLPDFLEKHFRSMDVTKAIGGFWHPKRNDPRQLEETFGLKYEDLPGFVGLANMAKDKGLHETSLLGIAKHLGWNVKKDKELTTSDWEADELSEAQKQYAADDVWFTLQCYLKLKDYTPPPPALTVPKFIKLKDINPESKGVNVKVKCTRAAEPVEGAGVLKEAVCGDDTGCVTLSLRGEAAAAVCTLGSSLRVQNAHSKMIKGHIRLVIDQWAIVKTTPEPHEFEVNEKNDISATEYELVQE
eukprot:CAMPEP_0172691168 /NCGR_PEP_ID=MMETSP1074-20121228/24368_1 /TAXON_ID=2916 /ORGANISM="Ceratium fusus, Strain PA161109" /LENGTH=330 /DNA_ID=CAMNT_0013511197 /DNA_START=122 /DNA_END=1114 /DNA_ORIENTATION=+